MLGVDVCEFGGQMLELLWLTMCYRGLMGDKNDWPIEEEERNLNYTPPAQKSLEEIQELDKDDESLLKYKQALLGNLPITADSSVPNLQVIRMTLLCDKAPAPITMDLTGDLQALKEKAFVIQEGVTYRLKIDFKVNKEIIPGLRYHHTMKRKGIAVDKAYYMVGSYGPKAEMHEFVSPPCEAPKGLISHGQYVMSSHFMDDDKVTHLVWDWNLLVKKDWNQ